MIKTFRGMMADGAQNRISLHTNDGSMGYRIVKFQIIPNAPGTVTHESVVKIYKIEQAAVDGTIDFSDQTLLAAAYQTDQDNPQYAGYLGPIVFDQEIFNQDIFVTNNDADSATVMNYYIELEQVKLNLDENTVATLKNIRNTTQ